MKTLTGHTTQDNAFIVGDYPYGYTQRTKIRYWIETVKNKGDRFCSQTLNPRTDKWNKPKKSTYSAVLIMIEQDNGHIKTRGISKGWTNNEQIDEFLKVAGQGYLFHDYQQEQIKICKAINNTNKHIEVTITNSTNWTDEQRKEHDRKQAEQKQNINRLFIHELNKIK